MLRPGRMFVVDRPEACRRRKPGKIVRIKPRPQTRPPAFPRNLVDSPGVQTARLFLCCNGSTSYIPGALFSEERTSLRAVPRARNKQTSPAYCVCSPVLCKALHTALWCPCGALDISGDNATSFFLKFRNSPSFGSVAHLFNDTPHLLVRHNHRNSGLELVFFGDEYFGTTSSSIFIKS